MRRFQLIEIMDQPWCPAFLRDFMTDYLQQILNVGNPYRSIADRLGQALQDTGTDCIIDLGSGSGGPWLRLRQVLADQGVAVSLLLTDRYPNQGTIRRMKATEKIDYYPLSVSADNVPAELAESKGFRTLFSSFHHFPPQLARAVLEDAVRHGQGIAIFEVTQRKIGPLLSMLLVPLFVGLATLFIRPYRLSRLFFTYVLPLVPLAALFDGLVSCLRTYTPQELLNLTTGLSGDYHWDAGEEKIASSPGVITYLIGHRLPTASQEL